MSEPGEEADEVATSISHRPLMQNYVTHPGTHFEPMATSSNPGRLTMSLPGLRISAPIEPVISTAIHTIGVETEWRFEVAFDSTVEIKASTTRIAKGYHYQRLTDCFGL